MSFDAGAIQGALLLETSGYTAGLSSAIGAAAVFPSIVTELLENPLLAVATAAAEAADAIVEAVSSVGSRAADMSLLAERTGLSVEQFSRLAAVASTVNVNAEGTANVFKFLERNAAAAVDGSMPKLAEAFDKIGISQQQLSSMEGDPMAIFNAISEGLDRLPNQAERTRVEMQLLGREGASLAPLFNMGAAGIESLGNTMEQLGATETTQSAAAGRAWLTMGKEFDAAWEGIEKAVAEPILDAFAGDSADILATVTELSKALVSVLRPAFEDIAAILKVIWDIAKPLIDLVAEFLSGVGSALSGLNSALGIGAGDLADGAGGTHIDNLHVHVPGVNVDEASSQIAGKMQGPLRDAVHQQRRNLHAAGTHGKVHRAIGGSAASAGGGY